MRRRMKARMKISLSSASVWTTSRRFSSSIARTAPPSRTRMRVKPATPRSVLISPAKSPGTSTSQQLLAAHSGKDDLETAGQDHQKVVVTLARLDQHFAGARIGTLTMRFEARELQRRELGKYLLSALFKKIARHRVLLHS